ncbi:hypothetical protein [Candidatus Poriferisodalis sp.]|uniref:hypothetical protein n=1 Tax=Candidatus Poriferisodalis sp. TaxID=3101277 RepID=UPI003D0E9E25
MTDNGAAEPITLMTLHDYMVGMNTVLAEHVQRLNNLEGQVSEIQSGTARMEGRISRVGAKLDQVLELLS